MKGLKSGNILIAEPFLGDPNFERAVILICEHNEKGTFGLVLNKNSNIMLADLLTENLYPEIKVDIGGPVEQNTLHYIHTCGHLIPGGVKLMDNLWWGGNFKEILKNINIGVIKPNQIRFFIGYSGWGHGQLEMELKRNSWIISKSNYESILSPSDESYWRETLKKLGGDFKVMSNYPIDPRLN
jgi:putative transcriptional regulator